MDTVTNGRAYLEPYLHLRFSKLQRVAELASLSNRQVLLVLELMFEGHQLLRGERCSGLPVVFVFPQNAVRDGLQWDFVFVWKRVVKHIFESIRRSNSNQT